MSTLKTLSNNTHVYRIEVFLKPHLTDTSGLALYTFLKNVGLHGLEEVRSSRLYEITGNLSLHQIHQTAKEILSDPITQDYALISETSTHSGEKRNNWKIRTCLRDFLADPIGESVCSAMSELGLPVPQRVRCATVYTVLGRVYQTQLEKAARPFFAESILKEVSLLEAAA